MTNFLHWRKMTWVLVLWSATMAAWLVIGGHSPAVVVALWFLGATGLGLIWLLTQPLYHQGRGLGQGFFVKPMLRDWRVVNLHRVFNEATELRRAYSARS